MTVSGLSAGVGAFGFCCAGAARVNHEGSWYRAVALAIGLSRVRALTLIGARMLPVLHNALGALG